MPDMFLMFDFSLNKQSDLEQLENRYIFNKSSIVTVSATVHVKVISTKETFKSIFQSDICPHSISVSKSAENLTVTLQPQHEKKSSKGDIRNVAWGSDISKARSIHRNIDVVGPLWKVYTPYNLKQWPSVITIPRKVTCSV